MGILDKVKEQAAVAGAAAKDAKAKGQAKLDEIQAQRAADGMLRQLGAAYYAQQTGKGSDSTSVEIERLVSSLQRHESEHGPIKSDSGI